MNLAIQIRRADRHTQPAILKIFEGVVLAPDPVLDGIDSGVMSEHQMKDIVQMLDQLEVPYKLQSAPDASLVARNGADW